MAQFVRRSESYVRVRSKAVSETRVHLVGALVERRSQTLLLLVRMRLRRHATDQLHQRRTRHLQWDDARREEVDLVVANVDRQFVVLKILKYCYTINCGRDSARVL